MSVSRITYVIVAAGLLSIANLLPISRPLT